MAIELKSKREIELIRRAGAVCHDVLGRLGEMVGVGVTTAELDAEAERMTAKLGATALFKGVPGPAGPFPDTICASINEEVVHGIPSDRKIGDGDVVSIDYGCRLDGYCGDAAETFMVGDVAPGVRLLVAAARQALDIAIEESGPGVLWSSVAGAMQKHVEGEGFSVIRQFVGHGIGKEMHEEPKVPNFVSRELLARDILLEEGLVIAVEPMVAMGSPAVAIDKQDGWTVRTTDGGPAGHFEHTLAVTADGVSVLTDGSR